MTTQSTPVRIEGFRCRADTNGSRSRYYACGMPAVAGLAGGYRALAGVLPVCQKHLSGNRRRRYSKAEEVELTTEVLDSMMVAYKEETEQKAAEARMKAIKAEARTKAMQERALAEDATPWKVVRWGDDDQRGSGAAAGTMDAQP